MTNFDKVKEFMEVFGQEVKIAPELPKPDVKFLRYDLIHEELQELKEALESNDIVETADALTDLLYVVYGAGHAFGIDLNECFNEVHRSNMSKLDENGNPIFREDGKVLKGKDYSPPDLSKIIGVKHE
jgi:predicted HAD superfamily Cof-like phosphohydrolase